MPSFKDADLAAIKARYKSNYALITNDPKIANDPVVIAATSDGNALSNRDPSDVTLRRRERAKVLR